MKQRLHTVRRMAVFTFAVMLALCRPAIGQKYTVTDMGVIAATSAYSRAWALNANGQAGGIADAGGKPHAFRWDAMAGMMDLGTLRGHDTSITEGINTAGYAVGISQFVTPDGQVFMLGFRASPGKPIDPDNDGLPPLAGDSLSGALGINSAGMIAGTSIGEVTLTAVVWDQNKAPTSLGLFPGGLYSQAWAINDNGDVVGDADLPPQNAPLLMVAVLWDKNGVLHSLGALPGDPVAKALAVNNQGIVVGGSWSTPAIFGVPSPGWPGITRAFGYDGNNGMVDLGNLGGPFVNALAHGINDLGRIVGQCWTAMVNGQVQETAFVYQGGNMIDLNNLIPNNAGWVLQNATAINATGQIVGFGQHNGQERAFLLTPPQQPVDLARQTNILLSDIVFDPLSQTYLQSAQVTNTTSQYIAGPFQFELSRLPDSVTLLNATGMNHKRPLLLVDIPGIAPGETLTVQFQFQARRIEQIHYRLRFFSGAIPVGK